MSDMWERTRKQKDIEQPQADKQSEGNVFQVLFKGGGSIQLTTGIDLAAQHVELLNNLEAINKLTCLIIKETSVDGKENIVATLNVSEIAAIIKV